LSKVKSVEPRFAERQFVNRLYTRTSNTMTPNFLGPSKAHTHPLLSEGLFDSPLLIGLARDEAVEVVGRASRQEWNAGSWVYRQGDAATQVYMLEAGRVKIFQTGTRGAPVVLRFNAPGNVFGHAGILNKVSYICSALGVTRCRTLAWSTATVWQLMRDYPRLAENVLQMLLTQVVQLQDRCLNLASESVERRLARSLSQLALSIGRKSGRAVVISEGFAAKDLADLSGTTIFTVSRVLGEWQRHGLVKKGRGWVAVLDLDGLLAETAKTRAVPVGRAPAPPAAASAAPKQRARTQRSWSEARNLRSDLGDELKEEPN
jgi:CRP-like cAMP-binding protein